MDGVVIGRLLRRLKHERIHLRAFETGPKLRADLRAWIDRCNAHRPHSAPRGGTPTETCAVAAGCRAAA